MHLILPELSVLSVGLKPSQTRSLIVLPALRRMLTASVWVAPSRDWPLTSIIRWPTWQDLVMDWSFQFTSWKMRQFSAFYLYSRVGGCNGAGVDFDTEDSLITGVLGVAWLSSQTSLDNHPELLSLLLFDGDLHEAGWERVVLDGQLDDLALLQEGHDGLLVTDAPDVGLIHGQDPVTHSELPSGGCGASRDNFTDVNPLERKLSN